MIFKGILRIVGRAASYKYIINKRKKILVDKRRKACYSIDKKKERGRFQWRVPRWLRSSAAAFRRLPRTDRSCLDSVCLIRAQCVDCAAGVGKAAIHRSRRTKENRRHPAKDKWNEAGCTTENTGQTGTFNGIASKKEIMENLGSG